MCNRRVFGAIALVFASLAAVVAVLGVTGCTFYLPGYGPSGPTFRVVGAQKIPPAGIPVPGTEAMFNVTFNHPVNPATLSAPGSVRVDVRNLATNAVAVNVAGVFQFNPPHTTAHFVSQLTLHQLVQLQPGQHLRYTIKIEGNQVNDNQGDMLDGEGNGHPGSNCHKVFNF